MGRKLDATKIETKEKLEIKTENCICLLHVFSYDSCLEPEHYSMKLYPDQEIPGANLLGDEEKKETLK